MSSMCTTCGSAVALTAPDERWVIGHWVHGRHFALASLPTKYEDACMAMRFEIFPLGVYAATKELKCNVSADLLILSTRDEAQRLVDESHKTIAYHEPIPMADRVFETRSVYRSAYTYDRSDKLLYRGPSYELAIVYFKAAMYDPDRKLGSSAWIACDDVACPKPCTCDECATALQGAA